MTIYVLNFLENSAVQCTVETELYTSDMPARAAMETAYSNMLQYLQFDVSQQSEEHNCSLSDQAALIIDGRDCYFWSIEAQRLEGLLAG